MLHFLVYEKFIYKFLEPSTSKYLKRIFSLEPRAISGDNINNLTEEFIMATYKEI